MLTYELPVLVHHPLQLDSPSPIPYSLWELFRLLI